MNDNKYIYQLDIAVRDYELDSEGIVNNANYLHYLELTRHEFCIEAGLSFAEMRERGMFPVVRRVEIDYLTSLRSGDVMRSCLWLERRGARFLFHQDIFTTDGRAVLRAIVTIVTFDGDRVSRGDELARLFAKYLND